MLNHTTLTVLREFDSHQFRHNKESVLGVYVSTKLTKDSSKKLKDFLKSNEFTQRIDSKYFHCTLIGSKENFEYEPSDALDNIEVEAIGFDIFGKDQKVIVLLLRSEELQKRFDELVASEATTDFPVYKPHITIALANKHNEELIQTLDANFTLTISHEYSTPFDANYKYDPKKLVENCFLPFNQSRETS